MRKININKINQLLDSNDSKRTELSKYISMKKSSLSDALNGKRPFPMSYVFEVADFLKVEPKELTICISENITNNEAINKIENNNKTIEEKV